MRCGTGSPRASEYDVTNSEPMMIARDAMTAARSVGDQRCWRRLIGCLLVRIRARRGDACAAPRSRSCAENAAGRLAQGGGASLQGGVLVAGHGGLVHLSHAASTEQGDQR